MTNFTISIVSDTVCPWCYVGLRKLQKGIALYQSAHPSSKTEDTFTTTWLPYYLNPTASAQGTDKRSYYDTRFGHERAVMMHERMSSVGDAVGIKFKFGGKTGKSRDSHRLIHLAGVKEKEKGEGSEGLQTRVVEELFRTYFEEEGDITDKNVLLKAGSKAGLDSLECKSWLDSDKGGVEVDREAKSAQHQGVTGVPNFKLQGSYDIGGAQEPQTFVQLFERIKQMDGSS